MNILKMKKKALSGNMEETYFTALANAEKDCIFSLYLLGLFYFYGYGIIKCNDFIAIDYFKKASEKGCIESAYFLGNIYANSIKSCIKQDLYRAKNYYKMAANKGHKKACKKLAKLYIVTIDPEASIEFIQKKIMKANKYLGETIVPTTNLVIS